MSHRHFARGAEGEVLDTFNDESLLGKASDVGWLGVERSPATTVIAFVAISVAVALLLFSCMEMPPLP